MVQEARIVFSQMPSISIEIIRLSALALAGDVPETRSRYQEKLRCIQVVAVLAGEIYNMRQKKKLRSRMHLATMGIQFRSYRVSTMVQLTGVRCSSNLLLQSAIWLESALTVAQPIAHTRLSQDEPGVSRIIAQLVADMAYSYP